jgi:hypothetical protein
LPRCGIGRWFRERAIVGVGERFGRIGRGGLGWFDGRSSQPIALRNGGTA